LHLLLLQCSPFEAVIMIVFLVLLVYMVTVLMMVVMVKMLAAALMIARLVLSTTGVLMVRQGVAGQ
jgi:hypothetical protein